MKIPKRKITVRGGTIQAETYISLSCCEGDTEPDSVLIRLAIENDTTKGLVFIEIEEIDMQYLSCSLNSLKGFEALRQSDATPYSLLDMSLCHLMKSIEFDCRRYPKVTVCLRTHNRRKILRGMFADTISGFLRQVFTLDAPETV